VRREAERGYETIEALLPALVTFSKGEVVRRVPSLSELIASRKKPVDVVSANDLNIPEEELGLKGSFTQVVEVFPPVEKQGGKMLANADSQAAAQEILTFLREKRFLS